MVLLAAKLPFKKIGGLEMLRHLSAIMILASTIGSAAAADGPWTPYRSDIGGASSASAQSLLPAIWVGSVIVTTTAGACSPEALPGLVLSSSFRPKLKTGEPNSGLSMFFPMNLGVLLTSTSTAVKMSGKGTYNASVISPYATNGSSTGSYNFTFTPANYTATTKFIDLTGTIGNFGGTNGCTATIRASYSLYGN